MGTGFAASIDKKSDQPAPALLDESAYHGTPDAVFARDWVYVSGQKLEGISNVQAATGGRVSIVSASGEKTVPAASLPQGFLYEWNLTPERLKAMDSP